MRQWVHPKEEKHQEVSPLKAEMNEVYFLAAGLTKIQI